VHAPDRLRKVVLISPAASFIQIWPFFLNYAIPAAIGWRPWIQKARLWINQDLPVDEGWENLLMTCIYDGRVRNWVLPPVFSDEVLKQIKTPILLLIGEREVIYRPERVIERATRLVPGLCAEIVPSANHFAAQSNPTWVNDRILQFLRE